MDKICEYVFENKEHFRELEYVELMKIMKEEKEKKKPPLWCYQGYIIWTSEHSPELEHLQIRFVSIDPTYDHTLFTMPHSGGKYCADREIDNIDNPTEADALFYEVITSNPWILTHYNYTDADCCDCVLVITGSWDMCKMGE